MRVPPYVALPLALIAFLLGLGWLCSPSATPPAPWPPGVRAKVQPHLAELDRRAAEARDRRLKALRTFFGQRQEGAKAFAEEALSWGGKWTLVQQKLGVGQPPGLGVEGAHDAFLADAFSRHIFSSAELKAQLQQAVQGYLSDLEGLENEMLVRLRADLADGELGRGQAPPKLRSDEVFLAECHRLEAELLPTLSRELGVTVGREVVAFIAMDIATRVVMHVAEAVAIELGVSAAVLGSGLASSVATLGVGIVVGLIIDALIDDLMKMFGHNPQEEVRWKVFDKVGKLAGLLVDGDQKAWQARDKLTRMAREDWSESVRDASRKAAERIEKGGLLGLRWELDQLARLRSRQREEALRRLVLEGGLQ